MSARIKKFYEQVELVPLDHGFTIELDRRAVRTPGRNPLVLPHEKLAREIAAEWQTQGDFVELAHMPVTQFANRVIDAIMPAPEEARAEIAKYAQSDLLCYKSEGPDTLVQRQVALWDPVLERYRRDLNISFRSTSGIVYVAQTDAALERFGELLAGLGGSGPGGADLGGFELGGFALGAVHAVTVLTGSALLAMALHRGWLDAEEVWHRCHVDEDFQAEQWGRDEEEQARRQQRHEGFRAATLIYAT